MIKTKTIHRVITRAKVMSKFFFFSEMSCRYSYGDLGMLALSVQKIKIEKKKRKLISPLIWFVQIISENETDVYSMSSSL